MPKPNEVNSSIIQSYSYDPTKYVLTVTFKSKKTLKTFDYYNVYPNTISQVFDGAGSVGSRFLRIIKGKYMSMPNSLNNASSATPGGLGVNP